MNKKIITTATTAILALGLLQGASIAYAEDFSQRMGGVGHGQIFEADVVDGVIGITDLAIGSMVIKLNGVLSNMTNTYNGEGFITSAVDAGVNEAPLLKSTFDFECPAAAQGVTGNEVRIGECTYSNFNPALVAPLTSITSDGECYIKNNPDGRIMGCNFVYSYFITREEVPELFAVAPVVFDDMF